MEDNTEFRLYQLSQQYNKGILSLEEVRQAYKDLGYFFISDKALLGTPIPIVMAPPTILSEEQEEWHKRAKRMDELEKEIKFVEQMLQNKNKDLN